MTDEERISELEKRVSLENEAARAMYSELVEIAELLGIDESTPDLCNTIKRTIKNILSVSPVCPTCGATYLVIRNK